MECIEGHLRGGLADRLCCDGADGFSRVDLRLSELRLDLVKEHVEHLRGEAVFDADITRVEGQSQMRLEEFKTHFLVAFAELGLDTHYELVHLEAHRRRVQVAAVLETVVLVLKHHHLRLLCLGRQCL